MRKPILLFLIFLCSFELIFAEKILFVRDGCSFDVYSYYIERIRHLDSDVIDTEKDDITFETLRDYDAVFWLCGNATLTLSKNEKEVLDKYLKVEIKDFILKVNFFCMIRLL